MKMCAKFYYVQQCSKLRLLKGTFAVYCNIYKEINKYTKLAKEFILLILVFKKKPIFKLKSICTHILI